MDGLSKISLRRAAHLIAKRPESRLEEDEKILSRFDFTNTLLNLGCQQGGFYEENFVFYDNNLDYAIPGSYAGYIANNS